MTQNQALELIMMGHNVYLTGQAGSGKTFLLNRYISFLKKNKIPVAVTATTGIAATHLNGFTIHSWSGLGVKSHLSEKDILKMNSNLKKKSQIEDAKVLIIDEISMLHSYRLDLVNKICKTIRNNKDPFGGLQIIVCGDFFQLPPINEEGFPPSSFAFKADCWGEMDLKVCYLEEQHRQWDEELLKVLNDIRSQDVSESTFEKLQGRLNTPVANDSFLTKLYSHNIDVDAINFAELAKIKKPTVTFKMEAVGPAELVKGLKRGCLASEELVLKEGAVVMFVKNNPNKGYINGTLGKVIDFDSDGAPVVQTYTGREIVATETSWRLEEGENVLAEISQVPLRLAWAITVHKSQGMSLDCAEIDLSKSFAYGMGYVALSRVRSLDGIKLLGINQRAFMVDNEIAEVDREFIKFSREEVFNLENLKPTQIKQKQHEHLKRVTPSVSKAVPENNYTDLLNKFFAN